MIKEYEKKVNDLLFKQRTIRTFTIRSFGENIYSGKIIINEANEEQADLTEYVLSFNNNARSKNKDDE